MIEPGDTVMGMVSSKVDLDPRSSVNFSGQTYNFERWIVDPETELLDFDAILKQAQK